MRRLSLVVLLLCSTLPAPAPAVEASTAAIARTVRIGVYALGAEGALGEVEWDPFQAYLNRRLEKEGAGIQVDLVPDGMESCLFRLVESARKGPVDSAEGRPPDAIDGAILSPLRYVVAARRIPDLQIVGRLRRCGVSLEAGETIPGSRPARPRPPSSEYQSLLLMNRSGGTWPPERNQKRVLGFEGPHSTGSYLFPVLYARDRGWIANEAVVLQGRTGPRTLKELQRETWNVEAPAAKGNLGPDDHDPIREAEAAGFGLLGIDAPRYDTFPTPTPKNRKNWWPGYRSEGIPYDVLATFGARGGHLGLRDDEFLSLQRAVLSTQSMTPKERDDDVFKWRLRRVFGKQETDSDRETAKWQRVPDIHDWEEATDEDYDSVRRAAVDLTGGTILRVAISERVHRGTVDADRQGYFRRLKHRLLQPDDPAEMVFLDLSVYSANALDRMRKDVLEGREVDIAELPAFHSSEAVGGGADLFALARFRPDGNNPPDRYRYVVIRRKGSKKALNSEARFAFTTPDSSSGCRWPLSALRERFHGRKIPEKQLLECGESWGVLRAVERGSDDGQSPNGTSADFGFMADFEWREIEDLEGSKLTVEDMPNLSNEVQTAALVVSPAFLKSRHGTSAGVAERVSTGVERFFSGNRDSISPEVAALREAALNRLKAALKGLDNTAALASANAPPASKFLGYHADGIDDSREELLQKHREFNPGVVGIALVVVGVVFIAAFGLVCLRARRLPATGVVALEGRFGHLLNGGLETYGWLQERKETLKIVWGAETDEVLRGLESRIVRVARHVDLTTGAGRGREEDQLAASADLAKYIRERVTEPLAVFQRDEAGARGSGASATAVLSEALATARGLLDLLGPILK